jgi:hypothetical protein
MLAGTTPNQIDEDEANAGLDVDPKTFGENGLLVMGVLGGFALATLALVISQQRTFEPESLSWSSGILWPLNGAVVSFGELYLFAIETVLALVGVLSIVSSLAMLLVSSSKYSLPNLHKFSIYSVIFAAVGLIFVLGGLLYPYSPTASLTFLFGTGIILVLYLRASNSDMKVRYKAQPNNKETITSPAKIANNATGDQPVAKTEKNEASPAPSP